APIVGGGPKATAIGVSSTPSGTSARADCGTATMLHSAIKPRVLPPIQAPSSLLTRLHYLQRCHRIREILDCPSLTANTTSKPGVCATSPDSSKTTASYSGNSSNHSKPASAP